MVLLRGVAIAYQEDFFNWCDNSSKSESFNWCDNSSKSESFYRLRIHQNVFIFGTTRRQTAAFCTSAHNYIEDLKGTGHLLMLFVIVHKK